MLRWSVFDSLHGSRYCEMQYRPYFHLSLFPSWDYFLLPLLFLISSTYSSPCFYPRGSCLLYFFFFSSSSFTLIFIRCWPRFAIIAKQGQNTSITVDKRRSICKFDRFLSPYQVLPYFVAAVSISCIFCSSRLNLLEQFKDLGEAKKRCEIEGG